MSDNEEKWTAKLLRFRPELCAEIVDYQKKNGLTYFTTAVFELIRIGLGHETGREVKMSPELLLLIERSYKVFENDIAELHEHEQEVEKNTEEEDISKYE